MTAPNAQQSDGDVFLGLLFLGAICVGLWYAGRTVYDWWWSGGLGVWRQHRSTSYLPPPVVRDRVFISYSHNDRRWMERLKVHLGYLVRTGKIDLWDDTMIAPGEHWREMIQAALTKANVAVLLVSADFLSSDFIQREELPKLLSAAARGGCRVIPLLVKPSGFSHVPNLAHFQAVNQPGRELTGLTEHEQEAVSLR